MARNLWIHPKSEVAPHFATRWGNDATGREHRWMSHGQPALGRQTGSSLVGRGWARSTALLTSRRLSSTTAIRSTPLNAGHIPPNCSKAYRPAFIRLQKSNGAPGKSNGGAGWAPQGGCGATQQIFFKFLPISLKSHTVFLDFSRFS